MAQAIATAVNPVGPARHGGAWPARNDPRVPFAVILTGYGVLGVTVLGFNRSPLQMLTVVVAGCLLDLALGRWLRGSWNVPLSAYITCCSLALLLNYSHGSPWLLVPVLLAIGSKYVLTFDGRHVFNPSMFGVAVSLLATNEVITAAPAYQWAGGDLAMTALVAMTALSLFVFRIGKGPLIVAFLVCYTLQTGLRAWLMRHHIPPEMLIWGTLASPAFFIFVFYMLTDPATSPRTLRGALAYSVVFAVIDLALHAVESVFTVFYTALLMASARFIWLHVRRLLQDGLRAALAPARSAVRSWLAVAGVASLLGTGMVAAERSGAGAAPAFRFQTVAPAHSGLRERPGRLLDAVDPRLAHVAKWILSVGDAVAVGDVDGDGRMDLFLTSPLSEDRDRAALYLNRGELSFERLQVPALARYVDGYAKHGLPAGASLVDFDGDGDTDLLLAVAFGPSRLLRNRLLPDGILDFEDATEALGLRPAFRHTVSVAATFVDADRDGRLDLLLSNVMAPYLPDYARPTPLNVFALPAPAHPGDRRMFRFMHDGWHDAANGGPNVLLLAGSDGRFVAHTAAQSGLSETRWSLAVASADFNRDGWTDLYVANDFGPDRLYLNDTTGHFRSVQGPLYGAVGRDTYKGMNASVADFDGNGFLDVYVSNVHHALQAEGSLLWMVSAGADGTSAPRFDDQATQRGALNPRRFGWGAAAGDIDNDGWPDIVQANGMLDDRLDPAGHARKDYLYVNHKLMQSGPEIHTFADRWGDIRGRTLFPNEARRAYLNAGAAAPGYFRDHAEALGLADPDNSRGVALVDLDNDGDLDVVITNQHGPTSVYRSTLRQALPARAFVGISLLGDGVRTHRTAIGSRIEVQARTDGARPRTLVRELAVLGGFSAQADPRVHVGLGQHRGPVEVAVYWYGGALECWRLAANRYHVLVQGKGQARCDGASQP